MRADRLIALLLLLQTRGNITAAEVALELEVSERTARRDLEALAMSGVPIYSTAGRGGGWKLLGGARTDLTGLSADEARALFLAAGPALESTPELKSAMRKLSSALPETFRADAEAASTAVKIDPTGWGQIQGSRPRHLDPLTVAVVEGYQVMLDYVSPRRGASKRIISPLGLVTKRGIWYLVANTENGLRTFRVTRVRDVEVRSSPVVRPEGFSLEAEWERIVSEVESRRANLVVRIHADPSMLAPLRYQFAGRIEFHDSLPDGRASATISEYGPAPLAAQLAGYGKTVEVLDPPDALIAEFTRLANELCGMWLSDESADM
jgi:predicted DNA-binding transcriptional regulator YafY